MPAKRNRKQGSGGRRPASNSSNVLGASGMASGRSQQQQGALLAEIPDDKMYRFQKDEIVWAKMKFFSAWPAKVQSSFAVRGENYKKKKCVPPKQQVYFFDNPPTVGEIHHNQIFKFVDNYKRYSISNNKKLQLGICQARKLLGTPEKEQIKSIEKDELGLRFSSSDDEEMEEELEDTVSLQEADVKQGKNDEDGTSSIQSQEEGRHHLASAQDKIPAPIQSKIDYKQDKIAEGVSKSAHIQTKSQIVSKFEKKEEDSVKEKQPLEPLFAAESKKMDSREEDASIHSDQENSSPKQEEETVNPEVKADSNQQSMINQKPKRISKPTPNYIMFQSQCQHNKRVKKQIEKKRDQNANMEVSANQSKSKHIKLDKQANAPHDSEEPTKPAENTSQGGTPMEKEKDTSSAIQVNPLKRFSSFDNKDTENKDKQPLNKVARKSVQTHGKANISGTDQSPALAEYKRPIPHQLTLQKNDTQASSFSQHQQPLISKSSSLPISNRQQQSKDSSQKQMIKEKILKMKELKKNFDAYFKEIKDFNRDVLSKNEEIHKKTEAEKQRDAEVLQNLIQRAYKKIQISKGFINQKIQSIFHDFNELSLIHESKLGHSLRDMQQFLEYYQSKDETIQTILGQLDLIIQQQEKRMYIEIFGENPLDCLKIKKSLRGAHKEDAENHQQSEIVFNNHAQEGSSYQVQQSFRQSELDQSSKKSHSLRRDKKQKSSRKHQNHNSAKQSSGCQPFKKPHYTSTTSLNNFNQSAPQGLPPNSEHLHNLIQKLQVQQQLQKGVAPNQQLLYFQQMQQLQQQHNNIQPLDSIGTAPQLALQQQHQMNLQQLQLLNEIQNINLRQMLQSGQNNVHNAANQLSHTAQIPTGLNLTVVNNHKCFLNGQNFLDHHAPATTNNNQQTSIEQSNKSNQAKTLLDIIKQQQLKKQKQSNTTLLKNHQLQNQDLFTRQIKMINQMKSNESNQNLAQNDLNLVREAQKQNQQNLTETPKRDVEK